MNAFLPKPKNLISLFPEGVPDGLPEALLISDVQTDSREVSPGSLFLSLAGFQCGGEQHLSQAIENGAVAILIEEGQHASLIDVVVPVIEIKGLRSRVAKIAANFYDTAQAPPTLFGITGTNGKSTISALIAQFYSMLGQRGAVVGTLGYGIGPVLVSTGMTTPDSVKIHRIIAELKEVDAGCIAMEVSSHGIHQGRIDEIIFDVGVISNITHDHLDYHGTFEAYAGVKKGFILSDSCRACVVNLDDEQCRSLAAEVKAAAKPLLTFGINNPSADLCASVKEYSQNGFEVALNSPWGEASVHVPFVGQFNLSNVLAAIAAACLAGLKFETLCALVPKLSAVNGRLQEIIPDMPTSQTYPRVFVDFAHTPDALERAIEALRDHIGSRLWVIFGCGGDRDRAKRGAMGTIAASLAERVVVTSDNPRGEDPQAIIDEIIAGIDTSDASNNENIASEVDREKAIIATINAAHPNDTILIAGKGHEDYQIIGEQKFPFSDAQIAKYALNKREEIKRGIR